MNLENLDTSLVDMKDSLLQEIIAGYALVSCSSENPLQSALCSICNAYIAGRLRGRKESMMQNMLRENEEC